jgi:hypothetical protein
MLWCQVLSYAGPANDELYKLNIPKTNAAPVIDGKLDDAGWALAAPADRFYQQFPFDTSYAKDATEVKIMHDDNFLYVSAVCYQRKYVVTSLRRDFPFSSSDIFILIVDPFRDKLNGFYFAVTPYGVQKEALLSNGVDRNADWDNVWYSETVRYPDRYVVEMAIPFKTLRYKLQEEGLNSWNLNFCRNNLETNEKSSWAPVPRNQALIDLAFCGKAVWENTPPKPGTNLTFIPYGLTSASKDFQKGTEAAKRLTAGFDAKVGVTPSLNLDLTVNPDFAQVEVDRQVTNLSRFELFFPERRQFFLENSDLFGSFGTGTVNPFFSRRIGLGKNENNGENVQIPILFGARLSGRVDKNWRTGFLNMTTAQSEKFGEPVTNYTVAAVQRRVGERNNLAAIFVNKQQFNGDKPELFYNRVAGLDYNFASASSKWLGKFFYHQGFTPTSKVGQYAAGAEVNYNTTQWNIEGQLVDVGANYNPAVGFTPRTNYTRHAASYNKLFFPKGKAARNLNNWYLGPDYDIIYGKSEGRILDWDAGMFFGFNFQNGAQIRGALARFDYTYLFDSFDPTNTGGQELPANTSYLYVSSRLSFASNPRRSFYYSISTRFGEYFNGNIIQIQTTSNLRIQPYATVSLDVNYTNIKLPKPYNSASLWLIGPRFDLSFSRKVFLTSYFQYNNQINNVNINTRFQYRFRPVSDIFLVYTDNYFATEGFTGSGVPVDAWQPKNRAIVLKFNYWLNL